jgi:hypothetical protein
MAACALVTMAACVRGEPEEPSSTPAPLTSAPEATGSPSASATASAAAAEIPDGRSFGYIKSVDESARTISFDLAQFLEGDAADKAYREDNGLSSDEEVDNDYYIRNENTRLRTLHVASDASIQVVGDPPDTVEGNWADFAAAFDSDEIAPFNEDGSASYRGTNGKYWVTVEDGEVSLIEEQYVP